jgi:hypothetical protein
MFKDLNTLEILRLGMSGLMFLLLIMGYFLFKQAVTASNVSNSQIKAAKFFLIMCFVSAVISGGFDFAKWFLNSDAPARKRVKIAGVYILEEPKGTNHLGEIKLRQNNNFAYAPDQMLWALVLIAEPAQKRDGGISVEADCQLVNGGNGLGYFMKLPTLVDKMNTFPEAMTNEFVAFAKKQGLEHPLGCIIYCRPPPFVGPGLYSLTVRLRDDVSGYADSYTVDGLAFNAMALGPMMGPMMGPMVQPVMHR